MQEYFDVGYMIVSLIFVCVCIGKYCGVDEIILVADKSWLDHRLLYRRSPERVAGRSVWIRQGRSFRPQAHRSEADDIAALSGTARHC